MRDLDDDIKSVIATFSLHSVDVGAEFDKAIRAVGGGANADDAFAAALRGSFFTVSAKLSTADMLHTASRLNRIISDPAGRQKVMRAVEDLGIANSAEATAVLTAMPAVGRA